MLTHIGGGCNLYNQKNYLPKYKNQSITPELLKEEGGVQFELYIAIAFLHGLKFQLLWI